jgi:predicted metalloprotease with PDZ domain
MMPGDTVTLTISRNDQLRTISFTLMTPPFPPIKISKSTSRARAQVQALEEWLSSTK